LMGRFEMEDIMAAPGLDNLHIIESGPVPANPSELLSTPAMGEFLRAVREEYDIVLIDTPPVLPVTDAVIVSAQADGVVLVYQAGKVGRLVLKRAKAHLESARARVWGVVLNDIQAEIAGYAYTHHYTHYYGEEAPGGAARGPVQRARDFLGGLLGRESRSTAQRAQGAAALILAGERETAEGGKGRRRRYRDLSIGVLILGVLVAAFAGVLAWRMGWLGGAEPRALLRQKLESLPPRPGSAPESAREPSVPAPASPVPSTPSPPATVAPAPFDRPPLAPPPAPAAQAPPRVAPPTPERPAPGKDTAAASAPVPDPARFAVELGPFPVASAAERVERQLNEAGFQTVRFRQQSADAVYAVWIGQPPGVRDAQALVATLRGQGFADASVLGGPDALGVRVGDPLPLVGAVQLAERLKAKGHEVRVTALPGQETTFVIRHGNFAAREEAEAKSRELHRLGLPNQIVRVR
ncbi:MAG: hypothetical protein HY727_06805, partial [Candidatus Rokubacteria bacterium]|nr:hypothetical protein [Candidatus Rokubacteria bacterium]